MLVMQCVLNCAGLGHQYCKYGRGGEGKFDASCHRQNFNVARSSAVSCGALAYRVHILRRTQWACEDVEEWSVDSVEVLARMVMWRFLREGMRGMWVV